MFPYGGAVIVIWRYPLNAQRLDSLRGALRRRQQRRAAGMSEQDALEADRDSST